jgi:DNA mismatch repair ATPase MutS
MKIVRDEIEVDFSKFPSIEFNKKSIAEIRTLIEKLNNRKKFLESKECASEFEKNEDEINVIKTNMELATLHTSAIKKENAMKEYTDGTIKPNYEDCEKNFDELMKKAEQVANKDEVLKKVLNETNWELVRENYDHKMNHYLAVKKYISEYKNGQKK